MAEEAFFMPHLVVTVTGRTMDELRRARDAAQHADIVEVRLDGVADPSAAGALAGRLRPVIVTCRARWEGGQFDGAEEERRRILVEASERGAEFVDVEARADFAPELIRARRGRGVVASAHLFGTGHGDLAGHLGLLRGSGAEVAKLAVEVDSLTETLPLFDLGRQQPADGPCPDHVLIAMGRRGVHTRVLAARLRNRWTYAGDGVAPGQMPAARLVGEFRFGRIREDADLYGVTGDPVGHSLSPAMHNAGFAAAGINAAYVALEARDADDFVTFARAVDLRGASVTAPFKVEMLDRAQEVDDIGRAVGAVNTIVVSGHRWHATNTDVAGFLAPLENRMKLRGARIAVLGAGGAARAVAYALRRQGAAVTVHARRIAAGRAVAKAAGVVAAPYPPRPGTWDVLVNATSAGGSGDDNPMDGVALDGEIVFDLVYSPAETALIRQARAAGCWTIGGIEMLIGQAEKQFELWTGAPPPAGLFRQAVDAARAGRTGARS
jgi:3-dehydroquinate dehydratase/shikimate dehydrogenase